MGRLAVPEAATVTLIKATLFAGSLAEKPTVPTTAL